MNRRCLLLLLAALAVAGTGLAAGYNVVTTGGGSETYCAQGYNRFTVRQLMQPQRGTGMTHHLYPYPWCFSHDQLPTAGPVEQPSAARRADAPAPRQTGLESARLQPTS